MVLKEGVQIVDFDAVSLYPSAQKRGWYAKGECKEMTSEMIKYYNVKENLLNIGESQQSKDQNTLFVSVKLSSSNIVKRKMNLLSEKREGIRTWINEATPDKIYYLTHIVLQDLINFQNYDYEIVEGVYFSERNYTINKVISEMFEKRVYFKNLKTTEKAVQIIFKLALNSSYGKLCEGLHDTQTKILD